MAVTTLLRLKDQRSLSFKRGRVMNVSIRHGISTPSTHMRAPRCKPGKMSKCPERNRDQRYGQNRDRSSLPTLFTFARKEWKKQQTSNDHDRTDQQYWCFERRRKQREQSVKPQEKIIRLGHSLDDCRIRLASWSKWAEVQRARGNRQDNECRKEHVFPDGVGNEWRPLFLRKRVIFGFVGCSSYNSSRHWPFVNAQLQHHQQMEAHEANQYSRNYEHM